MTLPFGSAASAQRERHVHFTFPSPSTIPSSTSMPNLAAAATSSEGAEKEGVETMLLGPNAANVSRAWREARDEEKRVRDKKRIKELEEEVRRLKGEVSISLRDSGCIA